jgi:hypothetical protein
MYQYLTADNIKDRFEQAQVYTNSLTTLFPELQRVADNKPKPGRAKHLPDNTDGTTSSVVKKTPRRAVQQLPTGVVTGAAEEWLNVVGTFICMNKIMPNANGQYELIEKCWQNVERTLAIGYAPIYCPIVHCGDYIGPDWINPWWGDIFIQPGKLSDTDSNYLFLRTWWRPEDIDALIDKLGKAGKDDPTGGWDKAVLENIKTSEQSKDDTAMTPTEKALAVNQRGGIELIIGFQRGVKSKFLTFHRETNAVARTQENKDPRGEIPVNFNYCETDGTNPFGRGFVEAVYPLQNLMDADDQMYQFNRALMLAPPVKKYGTYSKSNLQMAPNAIWDMGDKASGNDAIPVEISSTAVENYPALYQLNQSRIYNLLSSPTNSIPSGVGGVQNSKTQAGVQQQTAVLSIDDNFVRKKFEAAFSNWMTNGVNLWFASKRGTDELQLDPETAAKLRNMGDFQEGGQYESMLTEDDKIRMDYDSETEALTFTTDPASTKKQDDATQVQTITGLITSAEQQPILQKIIPPKKFQAAWNAIVAASGIQDPEMLTVSEEELKEFQAAQAQEQEAAQQAETAASAPQQKPLSESISLSDIYKEPTTPASIKAAIVGLAGLPVDANAFQDMQHTQATEHVKTQAENLSKAADAINPEPEPDPKLLTANTKTGTS